MTPAVSRLSSAPIALCVALSVLLSCGAGTSGDAPDPELDFRLSSLDGHLIGPADYRGQVLLVEFWATWCTPCRAQAKILESLYQEAGEGEEVVFLAISLGEAEETVRQYVAKSPFPYPVLLDPEDSLSPRLGIYALPTVMIVDREGRIAYLRMGISTGSELREALGALESGGSGQVAASGAG